MPRRGKPFTDPGAGKAQSMRSSSRASLGRADKHNGRAVLSGSKGPTIAWCPANGRTVGVCSNLDDLVDLVDLANPLSMTSTAVAAMSCLLSLASACFYLLKCKLHFALRFAFRAPSMTDHWPLAMRGDGVRQPAAQIVRADDSMRGGCSCFGNLVRRGLAHSWRAVPPCPPFPPDVGGVDPRRDGCQGGRWECISVLRPCSPSRVRALGFPDTWEPCD
jgi:hypothetical protein